jgi:hypothetical protein
MYPQDAVKLLLRYQEDEKKACDGDGGSDAEAPFSNVFFEFANTKRVGYKADGQEFVLVFDQDENACGHVSTSRAPSVEQAPSIVADMTSLSHYHISRHSILAASYGIQPTFY